MGDLSKKKGSHLKNYFIINIIVIVFIDRVCKSLCALFLNNSIATQSFKVPDMLFSLISSQDKL